MRPVNRKEFNELKKELLKVQGGVCPVSKVPLKVDKEAVIDHQHKLFKDQPLGENGAGLIRGVLQYQVNAWEGKVFNAFRRLGLHKFDLTLPEMLRNLADYLEATPKPLIHPSELPKEKKLGKRIFNQINKIYQEKNPKATPLEYPKSGKPSKKIKELALLYDIKL